MRLVHIQALHRELLPLMFVALDRLLATRRLRYAAFFGAALAAQVAQSIYLVVFAGWAAICGALARLSEWRGSLRVAAGCALVAGAVCGLLLLPVLWPYAKLAATHGMVRTVEDARGCAATGAITFTPGPAFVTKRGVIGSATALTRAFQASL